MSVHSPLPNPLSALTATASADSAGKANGLANGHPSAESSNGSSLPTNSHTAAPLDPPPHGKKVWTTLITNRGYLGGLLTLNHTLRKSGSKYPLVVMITPEVPEDKELMHAFDVAGIPTRTIDKILPKPRGDWVSKGTTWDKLGAFALTEYERVVLLDSDQIIRHNVDDLMEMDLPDGWIACCHACTCNPRKLPDYPSTWVPEDCGFTAADATTGEPAPITEAHPWNHHLLNSGTVVLRPSSTHYAEILHAMDTHHLVPIFRFVEQDLLSMVNWGKWIPLPYKYNALKAMRSCHAAMWKDEDVKILHFILDKPWKRRTWDENDTVDWTHSLWWAEFDDLEKEWLSDNDTDKVKVWNGVVASSVAPK